MPVPLRRFLDRLGGRRPEAPAAPAGPVVAVVPEPVPAAVTAGDSGLEIVDLTVRYGGLVAVDGLSLRAPLGRITGLIGPNGAGKTTTFNACSGLVRPTRGRILLHGHDVTRAGAAARARRGLGRTFQKSELWPSLTVEENIALGREAAMAGGNVFHQLTARPGDGEVVHECGRPRDRAHGHRRAARASGRACSPPASAGSSSWPAASPARSTSSCSTSRRRGSTPPRPSASVACCSTSWPSAASGLLLVEHDMALVMDVCEHIYVMDFGRPLFDGSPEEVRASELVQAAYLGSDEVEAVARETEPAGSL